MGILAQHIILPSFGYYMLIVLICFIQTCFIHISLLSYVSAFIFTKSIYMLIAATGEASQTCNI